MGLLSELAERRLLPSKTWRAGGCLCHCQHEVMSRHDAPTREVCERVSKGIMRELIIDFDVVI